MDNVTLQLLARIKIRLRQEKGIVINTQRFFDEPVYAAQLLDAAEDSADIDLVSASLEIRNRLGWLAPQPAPVVPPRGAASTPQTGAKGDAPQRYVFGARS